MKIVLEMTCYVFSGTHSLCFAVMILSVLSCCKGSIVISVNSLCVDRDTSTTTTHKWSTKWNGVSAKCILEMAYRGTLHIGHAAVAVWHSKLCDCYHVSHCTDDLVSECGATDVVESSTPTPSAAYLPANPKPASTGVGSTQGDPREHREPYATASLPTVRPMPCGAAAKAAAAAASSVPQPLPVPAKMSASGGNYVQHLPRLELKEPTVDVKIIEVHLPWLFWVQRQSKKQELDDILDKLE